MAVERSLLWLGVEEYTGLWEAAAEVGEFEPTLAPDDVRRRCAEILSALHARRWIGLYRTEEPMLSGRRIVEVGDPDVDDALAPGPLWEPPAPGDEAVRFKTTDLGRAAYDASARRQTPPEGS